MLLIYFRTKVINLYKKEFLIKVYVYNLEKSLNNIDKSWQPTIVMK